MSSSQPQFATTQDALNYQIAQQRANAQKAADAQAKAAADKAYFDAVQSQFRKDQAAAQAQGKTLTSQTIVTNEGGEGTVTSNFESARAAPSSARFVPNAGLGDRVIDLTPKAPAPQVQQSQQQQQKAFTSQTSDGPYANPNYNQFFGSQRIGDIINAEVAKGDKGLYASRTTCDYSQVKDYLSSHGRKSYTVELNDSLSGPKTYYLRDPTNPFDISESPPPEYQQINNQVVKPQNDFFSGFSNTLANIPLSLARGIQTKLYGKSDIQLSPEVEGGVYGALTSDAPSSIRGGFTLINPESVSKIADSIEQFKDAPLYAIGSLGASALTFFGPSLASKVTSVGSKALTVAKTASYEKDVLQPLRQGGNVIADIDESKAVSIGLEGNERVSAASPAKLTGLSRQPIREYFFTQTPEKIEPATDLITANPSRVTAYYQRVVKIGDTEYPLSAIRQGPLEGPKTTAAPTLNASPKDVMEPLAGIKPTGELETFARDTRKGLDLSKYPQYDKLVAVSESITDQEMRNLVNIPGGIDTFLGRTAETSDFFRLPKPETPGPMKPLNFGQTTTSLQSLRDAGIIPPATSGAKGVTSVIPTAGLNASKVVTDSLAAGHASKSSLGLYGATGAERAKASKTAANNYSETGLDYGITPEVDSQARQFMESFSTPKSSSKLVTTPRGDTATLNNLIDISDRQTKNAIDNLFGAKTISESLSGTTPAITPLETPLVTPLETPVQTPITTPVELTTTVPDIPRPTVPDEPNVLNGKLPVGNYLFGRRRNEKRDRSVYGLTIWPDTLTFSKSEKKALDIFGLGSGKKSNRKAGGRRRK